MSERAGRAERIPITAMGRSGVDQRSGVEYALALARETEASLHRDPTRWKWLRSGIPDPYRGRRAPEATS
jgi:hypothetical protein